MSKQWQPPAWEELEQQLSESDSRLIQTDTDLAMAVVEALVRLQGKLHGATPLAPFLWDEAAAHKPKNENRLSDFLKHFLSDDLNHRGVLINREVEIHNWPGKGRGDSLDLLIQATPPGGRSVASVVVEVKGCWNPKLATAMETQLHGDYLLGSDYRQGIYLVGWYGPPGGGTGCKKALDVLRANFDQQAGALSRDGIHLRAVVLDVSYPDEPST
jgi:hypothetical protein